MEIKNLKYYVKFVFNCEDTEETYSTSDIEELRFIQEEQNGELFPLSALKIGDKLAFNKPNSIIKKYKVTDISIGDIDDDLDLPKTGIYLLKDSLETTGKPKKWLLSIFVSMDCID
jgi:hypothetical protein